LPVRFGCRIGPPNAACRQQAETGERQQHQVHAGNGGMAWGQEALDPGDRGCRVVIQQRAGRAVEGQAFFWSTHAAVPACSN